MEINESNYVDKAEKAIRSLIIHKPEKDIIKLTTSQIRNLLAMSADIYNVVQVQTEEKLSDDIKARIDYLRIRVLYEAGRDRDVDRFVKNSQILDCLKNINNSRKNYILFYHYMEALVAFHRYLGGKD